MHRCIDCQLHVDFLSEFATWITTFVSPEFDGQTTDFFHQMFHGQFRDSSDFSWSNHVKH